MILLISALLLSNFSHAFSWEQAKAISQEQDLSIKSAEFTLQSSQYGKKSTYGAFLPSLTLSARKNKSVAEAYGIESQTKTHSYSATATLNLFQGFSSVANVQKSTAAERQAESNARLASIAARYQLRLAYADLYVQQERVKIFEKSLKRQIQNERLVSIKYESGTEAKWNTLKTKAERERAEYNLASAKRSLENAKEKLQTLLRLEKLPEPLVLEPIPDLRIPEETFAKDKVLEHPEYLEAKFGVDKLAKDVTIARSAFLPSIDLNYSKSREFNELGAKARTDTWAWSVVAQWNLFQGFSDYHQWQQARMSHFSARENFERIEREIVYKISSTRKDLEMAIARMPSTRALREAAEARVKTVSTQYRSGLKSYLDWEQAEAQLNESEQSEITALASALEALANYEKSIGKMLHE